MTQDTKSKDEVKEKEYEEMNVFDCKACGRKGFEKYVGPKHEETCLSKTAVFISKVKIDEHLHQPIKGNPNNGYFFLFILF